MMKKQFLFILLVVCFGLCGCPPIRYTFFIRNNTSNTVYLSLKKDSTTTKNNVRYKKDLIKINSKTIFQLNDTLRSFSDNENIGLNIPTKSTVCINDFFYTPYFIVSNQILFIKNGIKTDSLKLNYPYRKIKYLKRKRGKLSDDLFYRTKIYYDII